MILEGVPITYKGSKYVVAKIKYKGADMPIIFDPKDYKTIRKYDKSWRCNKHGYISCTHVKDNEVREIQLHKMIMTLKNKDNNEENKHLPIVHLNRVGLDNRRENIIYDTKKKNDRKNLNKKKRIIEFPKETGIRPNDIPTYVWYMREDDTHGDRFIVEVGDVSWKTTSSIKVSTKYKLEEAKQYLRELKTTRPELFEEYSMNGEHTKKGKELLKSFFKIVQRAGYSNLTQLTTDKLTDKYIQLGGLKRKDEKELLITHTDLINNKDKRRRLISNLPKGCGINIKDLPTYSYYRPEYENRGGYFVVENHPKQQKRLWQTTSSKNVSIEDKYEQLLEYLDKLK